MNEMPSQGITYSETHYNLSDDTSFSTQTVYENELNLGVRMITDIGDQVVCSFYNPDGASPDIKISHQVKISPLPVNFKNGIKVLIIDQETDHENLPVISEIRKANVITECQNRGLSSIYIGSRLIQVSTGSNTFIFDINGNLISPNKPNENGEVHIGTRIISSDETHVYVKNKNGEIFQFSRTLPDWTEQLIAEEPDIPTIFTDLNPQVHPEIFPIQILSRENG
jgi:hypothetical protein